MQLLGLAVFVSFFTFSYSFEILMVTTGATKSHKLGFMELAKGLIANNHRVTFINSFTPDYKIKGLTEVTPKDVVDYVKKFTDWDLLGPRMRGESTNDMMLGLEYGLNICRKFLEDPEIVSTLSSKKFDLIVMDGAFPECTLGYVHKLKVPFMYLNTIAFNSMQFGISGSPNLYSVTPFINRPYTDTMNYKERLINTFWHLSFEFIYQHFISYVYHSYMKSSVGYDMPHPREIGKNVSLILQYGHNSMSLPRVFLPNIVEIGCIHCKPPKPLNKDLEDFISEGGENGFILFSMGSSVKAANMPEKLRTLLIETFSKLPYQVLWKWEDNAKGSNFPKNIKLTKWLPQQDLLGHKKIRAFVTHGGLLSMYETIYHGVPIVTMPVYSDHDVNAAKAVSDGYALKLELEELTSELLLDSINTIIRDPKYKEAALKRQIIMNDGLRKPLDLAVYWTEYVIKYDGAYHLQSPGKDLNFLQYYSIDTIPIVLLGILLTILSVCWLIKITFQFLYYIFFSSNYKLKSE